MKIIRWISITALILCLICLPTTEAEATTFDELRSQLSSLTIRLNNLLEKSTQISQNQVNTSNQLVQFRLNRNLSLGDQGDDVKKLQVILNNEEAISVAMVGPGSPGQETAYFGPATAEALRGFQDKYQREIRENTQGDISFGELDFATRWFMNHDYREADSNARLSDRIIKGLTQNELGNSSGLKNSQQFGSGESSVTESGSGFSGSATGPLANNDQASVEEILRESFPNRSSSEILNFLARADQEDIMNLKGTPYYEALQKEVPEIFAQSETGTNLDKKSVLAKSIPRPPDNIFRSLGSALKNIAQPKDAQAVILRSFGGRLALPIPCTCQLGVTLTYIPVNPAPPQLLFQPPASQLKMAFNIVTPGVWLLGNYLPSPATCLVGVPPACVPGAIPVGIIYQVGTSAAPGLL